MAFDERKAQRVVRFIEALRHTKGEFHGQLFHLLPWQEKIIRDVFGTMRDDDLITASTTNGVTYAAGVCAWSGSSYDCGNTGSSISAGYGGQLPSHAKSQANAVSSSMGNEGYTSSTILYDSEYGTRSASASKFLQIRSASEILSMWS